MRTFTLICAFMQMASLAISQDITTFELNQLADSLVRRVENQMAGQNIAIAEFVDKDGQTSELGNYISEEFTSSLTEKAKKYNIIDRSQLRYLLKEAGLGDRGMLDPNSVQNLGHIEGVTAVIYGRLLTIGNYVKVYAKVIILEKQINQITVKGDITRTPTIDALMGDKAAEAIDATDNKNEKISEAASRSVFTHKNIQITMSKCYLNGTYLDCDFQIISLNRDDNFIIKAEETQLIDKNGKNYYPVRLSAGGRSSSIQANVSLKENVPVTASVRFGNIPSYMAIFSGIELDCSSYAAFSFIAKFKNITTKQ